MSKIAEDAIGFIKKNKKKLLSVFAGDEICKPEKEPISIFMAGSPGAGKTEFSKNLIKEYKLEIVRIDADEIREFIPQYNGKNSDEVQGAAALGVEKVYDYVLSKKKSFILDGTFANFDIASKNIERSVKKNRPTFIFYVYQDPKIAWQFTQAREELEGRCVPKEIFINAFLQAKENVNKIKRIYGKSIVLHLVEKNFENKLGKLNLNIDKIDNYLNISYNKELLNKIL